MIAVHCSFPRTADASNDAGITYATPSLRTEGLSHSAEGAMNGAGSSEGGSKKERQGGRDGGG